MQYADRLLVRKSVHFITGCLILALSWFVEKNTLLLLIIAGAVFSFATFNYQRFNSLHKTRYSSLGTLFYPLGVISSFLVLYDQPLYYFRAVIMVLTFSDIAAWLAGHSIKRFNAGFRVWHDRKSLWGTVAFAISTLPVWLFYLPAVNPAGIFWCQLPDGISIFNHARGLPFLFLLVIVSVNLEAVSFRGSDNFTIPVGLSLFFLISETYVFNSSLLLFVILFFAAGSFLLYKWRILDRSASLSAYLLGIWFTWLGAEWLVPILFFFISSVLFTRLHTLLTQRNRSSNRRNAWQVLANIIWALLSSALFLITHNEIFIYFFIALMAAVTADTWASELGPLFNKKCFSVADFRMHPAGITGGISPGGTMAAMVASAAVSLISFYIFFGELRIVPLTILTASGFLACFADTFFGAFIEGKLMRSKIFDPGRRGPTPNDLVNMIGSATAPVFYIILSLFV